MTKHKDKETSVKEKAEVVAKEGLIPAITAGVGIAHPVLGLLLTVAGGIYNIWGDLGKSRSKELGEFIAEHKDEFIEDIINGDDFKTLFLNVVERHLREASEEKRKLLRNYLLNVGKGINPGFNDYTRMNNALDTISWDEINMLRLWDEGGPIDSYFSSHSKFTITIADIQSFVFSMRPRVDELMTLVAKENGSRNNQALLLLSYKGLLYALSENNIGSGQEVKISEITAFGKAFLAFIKG